VSGLFRVLGFWFNLFPDTLISVHLKNHTQLNINI